MYIMPPLGKIVLNNAPMVPKLAPLKIIITIAGIAKNTEETYVIIPPNSLWMKISVVLSPVFALVPLMAGRLLETEFTASPDKSHAPIKQIINNIYSPIISFL